MLPACRLRARAAPQRAPLMLTLRLDITLIYCYIIYAIDATPLRAAAPYALLMIHYASVLGTAAITMAAITLRHAAMMPHATRFMPAAIDITPRASCIIFCHAMMPMSPCRHCFIDAAS